MKYKIDTTTWKRREHYEFFNGMDDPFWGTVVPVDFTECYLEAKKSRTSFFLCSLHRILTAVNRIEAFRYRIENGEVVCYDRIHASPTIGREDGSFGYGFFEYFSDLHEFIRAATNHLDITSKEILEEALKSYTGTVFFVSHDRYFINQTATRILELTGETVVNYIGNYDYYLEKHDQMVALYVKKPEDEAQTEASVKETAQKVDWQTQKAEQARIRKIENALKKAEEKIAELEDKIASIDAECAKPEVAVNSAKLGELTKQQSEYQEELEKQYEVWEELSMELDA